MNICVAGFSTVDQTTPSLKALKAKCYNLGSTHSGCLYCTLVGVSYSDPTNMRHSLMLV